MFKVCALEQAWALHQPFIILIYKIHFSQVILNPWVNLMPTEKCYSYKNISDLATYYRIIIRHCMSEN